MANFRRMTCQEAECRMELLCVEVSHGVVVC
jgi:hypothetical protein